MLEFQADLDHWRNFVIRIVMRLAVLIKDISLFNKSSSFISRNNKSKDSKNSDYSIDPHFPEKLRPSRKSFFSSSVNSYKEKLKINLLESRLSLKILFEGIFKRFCNFLFLHCHGVKQTYYQRLETKNNCKKKIKRKYFLSFFVLCIY